jgi:hypothetical protein
MVLTLILEDGEVIPEGLKITTNTLKLAFKGYDPITGCWLTRFEMKENTIERNGVEDCKIRGK